MKSVSIFSLLKDRKIKGSIILLSSLTLLVFSFIRIPVLTTIHEYTVGMLLGRFGPFFYAYYIYYALLLISNYKIVMPKWKNMTKYSYWFLIIAIVFIATTIDAEKYTVIGYKSFNSFVDWFETFTSSNNCLIPTPTTGGLVGTFMFSVVSMAFSGIGSIVISSLLLAITGSLLLTGSMFGMYTNLIGKRKKQKIVEAKKALGDDLDDGVLIESEDSPNESEIPEFSEDIQFDHDFNNENPVPEEPKIIDNFGKVQTHDFEENDQENDDIDDMPFEDPFE